MNTSIALLPLELRQVDQARRRARRYHLDVAGSLFGEPGLFITWGRIGRRARTRFEPFATESDLERRYQELLLRRMAHGYVVHPVVANGAAPASFDRTSADGVSERAPDVCSCV